jgi:MscS family membrane protein
MHDFWNTIFLSNSLKSWVIVTGTILFVVALKRFISRLIARFMFRFFRHMDSGAHKTVFLDLIVGPLNTFLVVLVSLSSIEKLHFPALLNFDIDEVNARAIFHSLAVIIVTYSFVRLLLSLVDFVAVVIRMKARAGLLPRDNQIVVFMRDFLKAIFGTIGVLLILNKAFGVDVGNIVSGLGLAGAALALAAKESIENLIASFVIFFDKPFTTGDYLKVNNVSGTVEKIGLRSTRIRTDQTTYVTVPNKQMVDSIVDNLTLRIQRKGELRLQLSLSTPAAQLDELVAGIAGVLKKDKVENSTVFLNDISGSAYLVNADYFTSPISQDEFNAIKQQVNLDTLRLLERMQITIAGSSSDIRVTTTNGPVPNPPAAAPLAPQSAAPSAPSAHSSAVPSASSSAASKI